MCSQKSPQKKCKSWKKKQYTSLINLTPPPPPPPPSLLATLPKPFCTWKLSFVVRSVGKPKVLQCMSVHFFLLNACSFFGSFRFGRGEDKSKCSLLFLLLFVASVNERHQDLHLKSNLKKNQNNWTTFISFPHPGRSSQVTKLNNANFAKRIFFL